MKKVEKKCDLCGKMIFVDEWGNGKCRVCGWKNNNDCLKYPDATNPPNFVSLNKAKELFKSKKQLLPTYDEMLELIKRGLDLSFVYKKKRYQLDFHKTFTLWEVGTKNYSEYRTFNEFSKDLKIGDEFVKDVWEKAKSLRYEC